MTRGFSIPRVASSDLRIGGKDFIVMTRKDFLRIQEVLEDAADVLAIREARKADEGKQGYTIEETRTMLGLGRPRRRTARRASGRDGR